MSTTDTDKTDSSVSGSDRTPAARALAIAIGMALMIATVLLAFSWPTLSAKPRHLPIDVVGTQEQINQVTEQMGSAQAASGSTDALDLRTVDSREQAVENIETRDAVGAIVLPAESGQAPEVLVASGGNAQIASLMRTMASQMEDRANEQVIAGVEDKVGTMLEAQQLQQAAAQGDADAAAKLAALQSQQADQGQAGAQMSATGEDFTIPTVSVTVTDIVPLASGDSTGAGLALAALPLIMGGIGGAGMTVIALSMLLLGNPLSGATVSAYFLPSPWGMVGQLLPPGAALNLLRNVSYFPQASSAMSWLVLLAWLTLGLGLNWAAKLKHVTLPARRKAREAAHVVEAAAAA